MLTIVTCTGTFDSATRNYSNRLVVRAVTVSDRAGPASDGLAQLRATTIGAGPFAEGPAYVFLLVTAPTMPAHRDAGQTFGPAGLSCWKSQVLR